MKRGTKLVSNIRISDEYVDASIHVENDEYRVIPENQRNFIRYHYENIDKALIENMPQDKLDELFEKIQDEKSRRLCSEPDSEQLYYIQDSRSYVGNCMVFWGHNNNGYVCDISKVGLYTYEQAIEQFKSRSTDIPWKKQDIEKGIKRFVDHQYVKKDDNDPFYKEIEEIKKKHEQKEIESKKANEKAQLEQELEWLMDSLDFNNIDDHLDFAIEFQTNIEHNSDVDWNSYYYPMTYFMETDEIFDAMIEEGLVKRCESCSTPATSMNDEYPKLCEACGEEKYYKDNPDES